MRTYHSGELVYWTPWSSDRHQRPVRRRQIILNNAPASSPLEYEWTWGSLSAEKIDVHGQSGIWWATQRRVNKAGGYVTRPPTCPTPTSVSLRPCHPDYSVPRDRALRARHLHRVAAHPPPARGNTVKTAAHFDDVIGERRCRHACSAPRPPDADVAELPSRRARSPVTRPQQRPVERHPHPVGPDVRPAGGSDPVAGFSGHHVSVESSGELYGQPEVWVEVARLWVYESSVTMERRDATHTVTLTSPAGLLERAEAPVQPSPGQPPGPDQADRPHLPAVPHPPSSTRPPRCRSPPTTTRRDTAS